jgi:hypothetical protein
MSMFERPARLHPALVAVLFLIAAVIAVRLSLEIARHGVSVATTLAAGFGIFTAAFSLFCRLASHRGESGTR